ncbi:uncharacterized protein LOC134692425 [Mytilus trossulus]|uniref:uncharacterized protein LOC134692425 n=1 Tax=Mytilus trossulus TaxID=6551 RepID=UPI0030048959
MAVRTFSIFVIFVVFTTVGANYGCTKRGGKCSDSYDCPSTGGEQEKLRVKCHRAKACCMCSDTCLEGSYCIASDSLCDECFGTVDPTGCCGDKVCCTPSEVSPEVFTNSPEPKYMGTKITERFKTSTQGSQQIQKKDHDAKE